MVSGSVKVHEVWRVSKMRRSSLRRGEKWEGSKGVRGLLLDGLGGVMREENLAGGGLGIFGPCGVWSMKFGMWLSCELVCCRGGGLVRNRVRCGVTWQDGDFGCVSLWRGEWGFCG